MSQATEKSSTLRELLTVVFRHKVLIASTFISVVVGVAAASIIMPNVYEAHGSLLVRFGRETVYRPEVGDLAIPPQINELTLVNSEIAILESDDLMRAVVDQLGPETLYRNPGAGLIHTVSPEEGARRRLASNLAISPAKDASVILVSFRHGDPKLAAAVVNTLFAKYLDRRLTLLAAPQFSFLEQQVDQMKGQLAAAEQRLESFKQSNGVASLDTQRDLLLNRKSAMEAELTSVKNVVYEKSELQGTLDAQLKATPAETRIFTEGERYTTIDDTSNELLALRIKKEDLLTRYTEDNVEVKAVQTQIDLTSRRLRELQSEAGQKDRTGPNPLYQQLQAQKLKNGSELAAAQARADALTADMPEIDRQLAELDGHEIELQRLVRDRDIRETNYKAYATKLEEAKISDALDREKISNLRVIQSAVPPERPISPKVALNIALAILLGSFGSLALAFVVELGRSRLTTPDAAERALELPLLASFPYRN